MASRGNAARSTEKAETCDLPGILRGRIPEASAVALIGEQGTGTTVISLHFMANALLDGRKVIVVSFDCRPEVLKRYSDSFGFDMRPHIAEGRLVLIDGYDILCRKMGISRTYEIENLTSITSEEAISVFDEEALSKHAPSKGEQFLYIADSFTAMSPFIDVRSAYRIVAEICDRMRNGGHSALLVGHEGVLESNFVQAMTRFVNGVIRLRTRWLKKGLTRESFVEKSPFIAVKHPSVEYEISRQGIELKYDHYREKISIAREAESVARAEKEAGDSPPSREGRITTGIPKLDVMLDGGMPAGTFVCVKGDVGTGTSTLCTQYAWSRLLAGEKVNYNCVDEPPEAVIRRFQSFGWNIDPYIASRKLNLADAYHFFAETPLSSDRSPKGVGARRKALDEFMKNQFEEVSRVFGTTRVTVVIDSFTAMAPYLDLKSSYVLARMVADSANRTDQVILATVRSSVVEANLLYACLGAANGLIEMENIWILRNLVRRMRIPKMVFTSIPSHPIEYTITSKGIELVPQEKG